MNEIAKETGKIDDLRGQNFWIVVSDGSSYFPQGRPQFKFGTWELSIRLGNENDTNKEYEIRFWCKKIWLCYKINVNLHN